MALDKLGEGEFGTVYMATLKGNVKGKFSGLVVVVKGLKGVKFRIDLLKIDQTGLRKFCQ